MGEYYKTINLDKDQVIYKEHLKLMEASFVEDPSVFCLRELLKTKWKNNRVALIGDYEEDNKEFESKYRAEEKKMFKYFFHCDQVINIIKTSGRKKILEMEKKEIQFFEKEDVEHLYSKIILTNFEGHYFYSKNKKTYINLKKCRDNYIYDCELKEGVGMMPSPICLLLATECKGGGGYYGANHNAIGFFAGDKVGITENLNEIKKFNDITNLIYFKE